MKIAVASGKGGTGKTTVSAALISLWAQPGGLEAPLGAHFGHCELYTPVSVEDGECGYQYCCCP
jgi:Mrp family chromosome partitioning ATPase